MINFRKELKFISISLSFLFLFNSHVYPYSVSKETLRVPSSFGKEVSEQGNKEELSPSVTTKKTFIFLNRAAVAATLMAAMAFTTAVSTPSAMTTPTSFSAAALEPTGEPAPSSVVLDNKHGLTQILRGLQYPDNVHSYLKEVLEDFFSRIWMIEHAKGEIMYLEGLAKTVLELGYMNNEPQEITRAFVNGLIGNDIRGILEENEAEDIFDLLDKAEISPEEKDYYKKALQSCTSGGQLLFIAYKKRFFSNLKGAWTRIGSDGHSFLVKYRRGTEYHVIDMTRGILGNIDLEKYYKKVGEFWVLEPVQIEKISKDRLRKIEKLVEKVNDKNRREFLSLGGLFSGLTTEERIVLLSYLLPVILITEEDSYGFTPNILKNCAVILKRLGFYNEAIAIFRESIDLNSKDASTHYLFGNALSDSGREEHYKEAEQLFKKALELNPQDPNAHYNFGVFLFNRLKDYNKAITAFQEAIKLNPYDIMAHFNLGFVYFTINDLDNAQKHWATAIRLNRGLLIILETKLSESGLSASEINEIKDRIALITEDLSYSLRLPNEPEGFSSVFGITIISRALSTNI